MAKKRNKKENMANNKRRLSVETILAIAGMFCGLYAYQYVMKPFVDIEKIDALYSRNTKKDDMRINFSFVFENKGNSKTKDMKLYSAFLQWGIDKTNVTASTYDFTYTDIADLVSNEKSNTTIYKDINIDRFIDYTNSAQGLYLVVVLRWNSDNIVYLGRTFENHVLFFIQPGMKDNKMIFQVREFRKKNFTYWFMQASKKPNIFQAINELDTKSLIFGDTSRFD